MASGKLGSADLTATTDTLLYTVPASSLATLNIRVANRNSTTVAIRVAIGTGEAPAVEDYIDYDFLVAANGVLEDSGIVCSAGEKVWAYSSMDGVSVRVHGFEEAA